MGRFFKPRINLKELWQSPFRQLKELHHIYGTKFLWMLLSIYLGVKGALRTFKLNISLPYYRSGGWTGTDVQISQAVSFTPWSAQGLCALLSDTYALFGYRKSSYMTIYTLLGTFGMLALCSLPLNADNVSVYIPSFLFLCVELMISWTDILTFSSYASFMSLKRDTKGSVVSLVHFFLAIGSLIPSIAIGLLTEYFSVELAIAIFIIFAAQPLIFLFSGCMLEDKIKGPSKLDTSFIKPNLKLILLSIILAIWGIAAPLLGLVFGSTIQMIYLSITSIFLMIFSLFSLSREVALISIYIFLSFSLFPNIDGPLEYFYTAEEECVENGPAFSYTFFKTIIPFVTILANLLAVVIFQYIFINMNFQNIFWITSFLKFATSLSDYLIVTRANQNLGLSDKTTYLVGKGILYNLCSMLNLIPVSLIIAKLAPSNIETTFLSVIASYANYGGIFTLNAGTFIIEKFGVIALAHGPGCNFENLPLAILVAHVVCPAILIPLSFVLIPRKRPNEFNKQPLNNTDYYFNYIRFKKILPHSSK